MNCQRLNAAFLAGTFALLFAICSGQAFAQASGGSYTINKSVFGGGGGTSTSGNIQITGTAGQRTTVTSIGGANTMTGGFWFGGTCTFSGMITPATLPNAAAGQPYSQTLTASGSVGPYTFVVTAGAVPNGMGLSSFGVLSGSSSALGTSNFTVTVTDGFGCTATQNFSLTVVCPTITVISPQVSTGTPGAMFNQTFTQSGGVGTITFSMTGTLPTGITFSNTGELSGTTNQTGVFPIVVTATDANGCTGTGTTFPLTIYTTSMLAPAPVPELLYYKFDGTGTSVPNLASAPPAGTATATLIGGMTQGGTDLCPAFAGGTLIGTGATSSNDYLNTGWTTNLTGTSWTVSFKTSSIVLTTDTAYIFGDNTGNQFRCFTGGISGAGNWILRAAGMENVRVPGATAASSTTTFVYDAVAGTIRGYLNGNLVATVAQSALSLSGTGPFKVGGYSGNVGLPNGGLLDDFRIYNRALTEFEVLSISNCIQTNAPTITPIAQSVSQGSAQTLPIATVSDVETPAGNLIVAATSVPAGISISNITNSSGNVSALITATCVATLGNNTVELTVSDGKARTATGNLMLNVTANTGPTLAYPASTIGFGASTSISPTTASDNGSITSYSIVSVTPAMTVSPTVNASGIVSVSNAGPLGSHTIVVQATDNCGATTNASFTLNVVSCGNITVSPSTLLNGLTSISYTQTLSAIGGTGSYTFSAPSGSLPAGLNLSGNMILGTPTAAGAFTFTIRATDTNGCFGERSYTVVIGSSGLMYYPLPRPIRLLDTRKGASANACNQPNAQITGGTSLTVIARGTCDGITIPANATTLTGNITTVQPAANGFLTLFPNGVPQPTVASSNFLANEVLNNAFTAGIGVNDGMLNIFASTTTHLVLDVTGYYAPPATGGLYFHPLPKPIRLLETRQGFTGCQTPGAQLQAGSTRLQTGVLTCDGVTIPNGVQALVGNATTTNTASNGYLTLYPADAAQPFTASSNFVTGVNRNAPFTVGLSPSGEFNIYTAATTDLVIDVIGYFSAQANDTNGQGLLFNSLGSPLRLMDTRAGQSACYTPGTPMVGGTVYTQETQVPCSNLTATARGLVGNVSAVNATANGFVTFWPSNTSQPTVATSNYQTGRVFNRHFTVGLGTDAAFKRYASSTTDLIIDISGFFAP